MSFVFFLVYIFLSAEKGDACTENSIVPAFPIPNITYHVGS